MDWPSFVCISCLPHIQLEPSLCCLLHGPSTRSPVLRVRAPRNPPEQTQWACIARRLGSFVIVFVIAVVRCRTPRHTRKRSPHYKAEFNVAGIVSITFVDIDSCDCLLAVHTQCLYISCMSASDSSNTASRCIHIQNVRSQSSDSATTVVRWRLKGDDGCRGRFTPNWICICPITFTAPFIIKFRRCVPGRVLLERRRVMYA